MDNINIIDRVYIVTMTIILLISISVLGYLVYDTIYLNHPNYELRKDKWACTKEVNTVTMMPTGKGVIPTQNIQCNQYTRHGTMEIKI